MIPNSQSSYTNSTKTSIISVFYHQCVLILRVLRDPGRMGSRRGSLSERFVDTLGGVREALCCRSLKTK